MPMYTIQLYKLIVGTTKLHIIIYFFSNRATNLKRKVHTTFYWLARRRAIGSDRERSEVVGRRRNNAIPRRAEVTSKQITSRIPYHFVQSLSARRPRCPIDTSHPVVNRNGDTSNCASII